MKQCDFSNYKVGDRVWHIRDGWQKIIAITDHKECPIRTEIGVYAIDGKYNLYIHIFIKVSSRHIPRLQTLSNKNNY